MPKRSSREDLGDRNGPLMAGTRLTGPHLSAPRVNIPGRVRWWGKGREAVKVSCWLVWCCFSKLGP